ncbi:TPA: hypothetical protein PNA97_000979 [Listeria monocytogenes]|nr:hypothetical protein [Listeria monocytogenes]HAA8401404.1 hypothetical protein [Listeria monocytogenes]HAC4817796.1 hypothetical protein [Listeria monocytogenes]HBJ9169569.1 hypothetical protein [Listeria monocytogenes]HDI3546269.1 hypothetical protein [Listeria monocytogenes]
MAKDNTKEALAEVGIIRKNLLVRKLCRHKNKETFKDDSYAGIQGERRVVVCKDCGELVFHFIAKYEGGGFK